MFTFGQPQFLLAALGLAAPVILHLMKRQVAVRVTFPSIRFILKGRLPKTGRRRLRDILLLFIRLCLFSLLVLALARLAWIPRGDAAATTPETARNAVFLLDASASMAGWNSMDEVKERMQEIMHADRFASYGLVVSARGIEQVLELGSPSEDLRNLLDTLEPLPFEGDHAAALDAAADMLRDAGGGTLYIASDFQATDWALPRARKLPASVEPVFLRPDTQPDGNLAIMNVRSEVVPDGTIRVIVQLQNDGTAEQTVQLRLNAGTVTRVQRVEVPPMRPFRTVFSIRNPDTQTGEVIIETDDGYAFDNRYAAWLGGEPPIRVLAVIPSEQEPAKENELFFLRKALEVEARFAARRFEVQEVEANLLWSIQPESQDALVLMGALAHLDDQGIAVIQQYLAGGGVVLSTPSRAPGRQFMQMRRHDLLDAEYRGVWSVENRYRDAEAIGWINQESILGTLFADAAETDLFVFPIYRFVQIRTGNAVNVLLRTANDDPILVEQEFQNGMFFASTIGFDPGWSDLPMSSVFLPLVRELLTAGREAGGGVLRVACGEPLPPVVNLAGDPVAAADAAATDTPGVLLIGQTPVEINVSRRESSAQRRSLLALRDQLTDATATAEVRAEHQAHATARQTQAIELWPWLAGIAGLLATLELILAFGLDRAALRTGPANRNMEIHA